MGAIRRIALLPPPPQQQQQQYGRQPPFTNTLITVVAKTTQAFPGSIITFTHVLPISRFFPSFRGAVLHTNNPRRPPFTTNNLNTEEKTIVQTFYKPVNITHVLYTMVLPTPLSFPLRHSGVSFYYIGYCYCYCHHHHHHQGSLRSPINSPQQHDLNARLNPNVYHYLPIREIGKH